MDATVAMMHANTAWILTSTALVLLMTLPGLALFYGGLVQSKNILSILMQCMTIACFASVVWFIVGYSIAFGDGGAYWGGLDKALLSGVDPKSVKNDLPESLFVMFQMTFAIITPALMVGAFIERIKFSAVVWISVLWILIVYAPVTHWIWGGGWLAAMGVLDFAGGLVVHLTAGVSALVIVAILGPRKGFPDQVKPPHAPWMVMVGAALLWVGWFGFNAGSALKADQSAAMAMLVTHMSAAVASLVWLVIEWLRFGKPSLVGLVTGTIAGLATITPASGFVEPEGGIILGLVGGLVCYFAVDIVKRLLKLDDSLDVLAVHGVGGLTGTLLAAFLTFKLGDGVQTHMDQFLVQLQASAAVLIWSLVATVLIVIIVRLLVGLRVPEEQETAGLDLSHHGETGYNL